MKRVWISLAFVAISAVAFAQAEQLAFQFGPRIWGASVAGRYIIGPPSVAQTDTALTFGLSGAYEGFGYYRLPSGGLFSADAGGYSEESASISRLDFVWQAGVQQGILPGIDQTDDRAIVFLLYRGQYDLPFQKKDPDTNEQIPTLFFDSALPETNGNLHGAILSGLAYKDVVTTAVTGVQRGLHSEFSVEWAPSFLHNQILGVADYSRLTLSAKQFVPIAQAPLKEGRNVFAAYFAGFAVVDWASGPQIPLAVRTSTGGRSVRSAPGGSVRGYESRRFDATFKAIGNAEVRMTLPSLGLPTLVPGLVVYTDAGYYSDSVMVSPSDEENSGILVSSGLGVSINLLDMAELVFYTNFLLTEEAVDGSVWVPFTLGFGYHF